MVLQSCFDELVDQFFLLILWRAKTQIFTPRSALTHPLCPTYLYAGSLCCYFDAIALDGWRPAHWSPGQCRDLSVVVLAAGGTRRLFGEHAAAVPTPHAAGEHLNPQQMSPPRCSPSHSTVSSRGTNLDVPPLHTLLAPHQPTVHGTLVAS